MKRIVLFLCAAAALTGCASTSPSTPDAATAFASPAQRAYQLGVEHRMVQDCRPELGAARVSQHAESAQLLLTSYPVAWRDAAKSAFARGYAAGPARFHHVPCEGIQSVLDEQLACNAAETRRNLKTAAHLK